MDQLLTDRAEQMRLPAARVPERRHVLATSQELTIDKTLHLHAHLARQSREIERVQVLLQRQARQRAKHRKLLLEPLTTTRVALLHHAPDDRRIRRPILEVAAPAQHQRLVHCLLDPVVRLLHITVLMGLTRLDRTTFRSVVPQQRPVPTRELLTMAHLLHRRRQPVGPMRTRHAPQLPKSVLKTLAQALEALRETERPRLPVRVRQHEVMEHVVEPPPTDRHPQLRYAREVELAQLTRLVLLREEHLPSRTLCRTPHRDPTPQRAQLPVLETTRIPALQMAEDRHRTQPRIDRQKPAHLIPHVAERIGPRRALTAPQPALAGQIAGSKVLPRCLLAHVCLRGRLPKPARALLELPQSPHLLICDHLIQVPPA